MNSTPAGSGMGALPILDMCRPHQMKQITSPPRPSLRASALVTSPRDVEMIAVPSPPSTLGNDSFLAYTRRPGLETRLMPEMTRSLFLPYLSSTWMTSPCSTFIREEGISTMLCRAVLPLRTRVSMSAMGSVIDMVLASSPARLGQTGDDALVRDFAQTDAADPELAVVRTRAAAPGATVVLARLVALLAPGFHHEGCLSHASNAPSSTGTACRAWPAGHAPPRPSWRSS